jgi:hypothetical protein
MCVDLDDVYLALCLETVEKFFIFEVFLGSGRRAEVRIIVDIVELVELFVVLEDDFEDGVGFGVLVEQVEAFVVEGQGLNHHLLGEHHHDQILETPADDHVADGCGNELLIEPLLGLLVGEEALGVFSLVR